MSERKTGAGMHLSGVLERAQPPRPERSPEPPDEPAAEAGPKGRGGAPSPAKAAAPRAARTAKRIKGRTIYIGDDLFERIIVQAHRRNVTISDYVCLLLDRHVPDHRVVRSGPAAMPEPGESEAG